jgi:hypothetical protein
MENEMTNPLIGKTVVKVEMTTDNEALRFTCSDGTTELAVCYADCCSLTWIEYIEDAENLLGTVVSVENLELKPGEHVVNDDPDNYNDFVQFYGCKIYTEKGYCLIDFRNESNGYYGGDLMWGGRAMRRAKGDWEWQVIAENEV